MNKQKRETLILLISSIMVIAAIAVSFAHRNLVANNSQGKAQKYDIPVVTDAVIPATGPIHQLTSTQ